jgi:hypothetical protein
MTTDHFVRLISTFAFVSLAPVWSKAEALEKSDSTISMKTAGLLAETVLPLVDVRNVPFTDFLQYLQIRFIDAHPSETKFRIWYQPPTMAPITLPGKTEKDDPEELSVSFTLKAIPMHEMLKQVANLTDTKFRVNGAAVVFARSDDEGVFLPLYDLDDWKAEAFRVYPDLRNNRSEMFQIVFDFVGLAKQKQPSFFADVSWPLQAATLVGEKLGVARQDYNPSVNVLEYTPKQTGQSEQSEPTTKSKSPQEIAKQALPSVFTVHVVNDAGETITFGSGFLVSETMIATNMHVISDQRAKAVFITSSVLSRPVLVESVPLFNADVDLAVLTVAAPLGTPLTLGKAGEIGETVYVIGSPKGLEGTFSSGVVSAYREVNSFKQLQISAPISSGSSGGPVLNAEGHVIGVSVATYKSGQNLNFAVPVEYLARMLGR